MFVRVLKRGEVVAERARMLAYTLSSGPPGDSSCWAGALKLETRTDGQDLFVAPLDVEFPCGGRAQVEVRRVIGGVVAQFSGIGPPPPGLP